MDVSERSAGECDSIIPEAVKSYDFMKNMPVFNANNFSKCSKDLMRTKVRSKYVCDVPISPDEKRIQVERAPLILKYLKNHWTVFPQKTTDNNDVFISRRGHKRGHNELSNAECSSNGSQSDNAPLSSSSRHRQTLNPKTRHRMVLNDSEDVHLSDDSEDNDDDVKVITEDSSQTDHSESRRRMFLKMLRRNNSNSEEHNEQSAEDNTEQSM